MKIAIIHKIGKVQFSAIANNPAEAFPYCKAIVDSEFDLQGEHFKNEELTDMMRILLDIYENGTISVEKSYFILARHDATEA